MKQNIYIFFFLCLSFNNGSSQPLEQILEEHYKAIGMEYLKEVQTIRYKGHYVNHFLKKPGKDIHEKFLKPDFVLSIDKQRSYLEQVFGKYGEDAYAYTNNKFWRDPSGSEPYERNPTEKDKLRIQLRTDIEGVLYNWEKKGYTIKKMKDAVFKNGRFYKIRLTSPEKDTLYYYINPQNNLIYKMSYSGDLTDGNEYRSVTFMKYKKVQNILFAFKQIQRSQMLDGSFADRETVISEIEINPKFDKELFDVNKRVKNLKTN